MSVLESSVIDGCDRTQAIEVSKVRPGSAPVAQPITAQVALGATARPYLSNPTEAGAITAVISSIGQVPQRVLETRPSNHPTFTSQSESLAPLDLKKLQLAAQQPIVTDTPIKLIVSLSEMTSGNAVITTSTQQSVPTQIPSSSNVPPSVQTMTQKHSFISIEHLALTDAGAATSLRGLDFVGAILQMSISQSEVNNAPNLLGIGTLINLTPISTLSSRTTQPIAESNAANTFDGITVSGQADVIEVLVITTSGLNPLFGQVNSSGLTTGTPNSQNLEASAYALDQHSIILISVQTLALSEAYPL